MSPKRLASIEYTTSKLLRTLENDDPLYNKKFHVQNRVAGGSRTLRRWT